MTAAAISPMFTPEDMSRSREEVQQEFVGQAQQSRVLAFNNQNATPRQQQFEQKQQSLKAALGVGDKIKVKHRIEGDVEIEVQDFILDELDDILDKMADVFEVIQKVDQGDPLQILRVFKEKKPQLMFLLNKVTGKDAEWFKGVPMSAGGRDILQATWTVCEDFFSLLTGVNLSATMQSEFSANSSSNNSQQQNEPGLIS